MCSLSWCRTEKREFQRPGPLFMLLPWLTPHQHSYPISWNPQTSGDAHLLITFCSALEIERPKRNGRWGSPGSLPATVLPSRYGFFVCLFLVQHKHLRSQFSSDLERGGESSPSPLFTRMLSLWPQWDLVNSTASKKRHHLALNDPLAPPKTLPCSSQECPHTHCSKLSNLAVANTF